MCSHVTCPYPTASYLPISDVYSRSNGTDSPKAKKKASDLSTWSGYEAAVLAFSGFGADSVRLAAPRSTSHSTTAEAAPAAKGRVEAASVAKGRDEGRPAGPRIGRESIPYKLLKGKRKPTKAAAPTKKGEKQQKRNDGVQPQVEKEKDGSNKGADTPLQGCNVIISWIQLLTAPPCDDDNIYSADLF